MEMMSKAEHLILSSMVHGTPLEQHHLVPRMKQLRMGMEWGQSTWAKNPAKKSQKGCTDGTDGWIWLLKFWTERHSKCSTMPGTDISYIFFKKCIIIYIYTCSYLFLFQYFNIHTFACAPFDDCPEKNLNITFVIFTKVLFIQCCFFVDFAQVLGSWGLGWHGNFAATISEWKALGKGAANSLELPRGLQI